MNFNKHKEVFNGFFRAGMLGFGGGPSAIPLIHKEAVERYKWMTDDEFSETLALGNALPGPIATKMAGYIGYRVAGISGLINAIIATVLPTVLLMMLFLSLLSSFRDIPAVEGMVRGVAPVVGVMLITLTYSFIKQSKGSIGWKATIILALISVIVYQFLSIHPAILIGSLIIYALISAKKSEEKHTEEAINKKEKSM